MYKLVVIKCTIQYNNDEYKLNSNAKHNLLSCSLQNDIIRTNIDILTYVKIITITITNNIYNNN